MNGALATPRPEPLLIRLGHIGRDIKLAHSIFALPFALLAMFLAAATAGRLPTPGEGLLIILCMVLARTFAMTVNRWADAAIDAANPRTATRAIPAGRLSRRFVATIAGLCAAGFVATTTGFHLLYHNPWPLRLALPTLALIGIYSFTKRYTWLCHLVLGLALAASPIAAAIAIEPSALTRPPIWLLAGMVVTWVAGFDIIYALQDVHIDRTHGLHSMPARLGIEPALWISRALHTAAAGLLIALAILSPHLHSPFNLAVALTAALLVTEHALIIRSPARHLHTAFFTLNGIISLLLGTAGILDTCLTH